MLDRRELGTVLAALRHWQEYITAELAAERFDDIATDGDTLEPLTVEEIDDLCERLNTGVLTE